MGIFKYFFIASSASLVGSMCCAFHETGKILQLNANFQMERSIYFWILRSNNPSVEKAKDIISVYENSDRILEKYPTNDGTCHFEFYKDDKLIYQIVATKYETDDFTSGLKWTARIPYTIENTKNGMIVTYDKV